MDMTTRNDNILLREPKPTDGARLHSLIAACPPLDENSVYCNLLQCSHFAATTVVAERNGALVGAISGYLLPERPDTLFIWQVAVSEQARGAGLAVRMLDHIVQRDYCAGVSYMETTVTGDNEASWAMFQRFASNWGAQLARSVCFDRAEHFQGHHDTEFLARIGPLQRPDASRAKSAITLVKEKMRA